VLLSTRFCTTKIQSGRPALLLDNQELRWLRRSNIRIPPAGGGFGGSDILIGGVAYNTDDVFECATVAKAPQLAFFAPVAIAVRRLLL
jgi:hypothetical protein